MSTNLTPCPACKANDCGQCTGPSGSRLDASDVERATCCCGRRFRPVLRTACALKWCDLDAGHDPTHQAHMAAVVGERRATIALTVESSADDGRHPLPVVSAGNGSTAVVVLGWDELHELACAMLTAHRRHATPEANTE